MLVFLGKQLYFSRNNCLLWNISNLTSNIMSQARVYIRFGFGKFYFFEKNNIIYFCILQNNSKTFDSKGIQMKNQYFYSGIVKNNIFISLILWLPIVHMQYSVCHVNNKMWNVFCIMVLSDCAMLRHFVYSISERIKVEVKEKK